MMRRRQHFLAIFLLLAAFMPLSATILFHDNFQRSDGDIGNGWTEIGSNAATIDDGEMLITAAGGSGVYRDFPALTDGTVSVQYDWKVESLSGSFLIYPLETSAYLLITATGDLYYDLSGNFVTPVLIGSITLDQWHTFRMDIDLDSDTFSIWLDDSPLIEDISGNSIASFSKWKFVSSMIGAATMRIDEFIVSNGSFSDIVCGPVTLDNQLPTIAVTSPNGGEEWYFGDTHDIQWTASDDHLGESPIHLSWSSNGGADYTDLTDTDNSGSWAWTLPTVLTESGLVKAVATDAFGNASEDISDSPFAIGYVPPAQPQNLVIDVSDGQNAVLSWQPVTTTIYGTPLTPDCYIIRYSGMPQSDDVPYFFLGISSDSTFTHPNVVEFSDFMFYQVAAWVDHEDRLAELLEVLREPSSPDPFSHRWEKGNSDDYCYPMLSREPITWEELLKTVEQAKKRPGGDK